MIITKDGVAFGLSHPFRNGDREGYIRSDVIGQFVIGIRFYNMPKERDETYNINDLRALRDALNYVLENKERFNVR